MSDGDTEDRYFRRPFLRLLESYVLWSAGELPEDSAKALEDLAPKLRETYGVAGSWQEVVARQMDFSDDVPAALRAMWERNLETAAERGERLDPEQWAQFVVDTNFV